VTFTITIFTRTINVCSYFLYFSIRRRLWTNFAGHVCHFCIGHFHAPYPAAAAAATECGASEFYYPAIICLVVAGCLIIALVACQITCADARKHNVKKDKERKSVTVSNGTRGKGRDSLTCYRVCDALRPLCNTRRPRRRRRPSVGPIALENNFSDYFVGVGFTSATRKTTRRRQFF